MLPNFRQQGLAVSPAAPSSTGRPLDDPQMHPCDLDLGSPSTIFTEEMFSEHKTSKSPLARGSIAC